VSDQYELIEIHLIYRSPYFLSLLGNLAKFICLLLDLCLSDAGAAAASLGSAED